MDVPSKPGDTLAQPTRARLFALLSELRRPAPTEELAERLALHPNGIRAHLEILQAGGLVLRERERLARGRPRDSWTISPGARPGGSAPTAYADLGRWLVRAIASGRTELGEIEAIGREIGQELVPGADQRSAEQQLHDVLSALGFQPEPGVSGPDRQLTFRLGNCPYREATRERQQVVCGMHRGITRGLLDAIEPQTELVGFVPQDPDAAGCLIELRGPIAAYS